MISKKFNYNAEEINIVNYPQTFDDILICPEYSEVKSRKNVDVSMKLVNLYNEIIDISLPIVNTPHPDIEVNVIDTFIKKQLIFNIPRFGRYYNDREEIIKHIKKKNGYVMLSVGLKDFELVKKFVKKRFVDFISFDLAHGTHPELLIFINNLLQLKEIKNINAIILGNFGKPLEYKFLQNAFQKKYNSDVFPQTVKVGIGSGSACLTRLKTGVGIPQFYAIRVFRNLFPDHTIISDGGINYIGDIAKALIYADLVFIGKLLFKCYGVTKNSFKKNSSLYNYYSGISLYDKNKINFYKKYVEGFRGLVKVEYDDVAHLFTQIKESLQSTLSYCGVKNLADFKQSVSYFVTKNYNVMKENSVRFDND